MRFLIVLAGLALLSTAHAQSTNCSLTNNAVTNLNACIADIVAVLEDTVRWPYGSNSTTPCTETPNQPLCENIHEDSGYSSSISSIIGISNFSSLTTYIYVAYSTPAGTISGCNSTLSVAANSFNLDLSLTPRYPWQVRTMPTITFTSTSGTFYTLIIFDTAWSQLAGYFVNIQNNDVAGSDVVFAYQTPLNGRVEDNPVLFMLFTQAAQLTSDQVAGLMSNTTAASDPVMLIEDMSMTLIGVNIMVLTTDISGVEAYHDYEPDSFNCEQLALKFYEDNLAGELMDQQTYSSDFYLQLFYSHESFSFDYCCVINNLPVTSAGHNHINDQVFPSTALQENSTIQFVVEHNSFTDSDLETQVDGNTYMVMAFSFDVGDATLANSTHPYLHYLAYELEVNTDDDDAFGTIEVGDDGRVFLPWKYPRPTSGEQRVYVLMMEIADMVTFESDMMMNFSYTEYCGSGDDFNRCLFDLTSYLDDIGTGGSGGRMRGISWFRVANDDYINYALGVACTCTTTVFSLNTGAARSGAESVLPTIQWPVLVTAVLACLWLRRGKL